MANLLVKGAAFPGSPSSDDPFFRDDLGFWCYYDGTRWLGPPLVISRQNITVSANGNAVIGTTGDDYSIYMDNSFISTNVATTNNGSNYWTLAFTVFDMTLGNSEAYYTVNTSSDSANTWVDNSGTPSTRAVAYSGPVAVACTKTGSPGNISLYMGQYFRQIIT
jgi:hypothetical protein